MDSRAQQYAEWLVNNQDKKGEQSWQTVASAYRSLRSEVALSDDAQDVAGFVRATKGMETTTPIARAFDHTAGMSGPEKFAAGAGKAVSDAALGLRQMIGLADQTEVDVVQERDADLMGTGAGSAGNIGGKVALFAPTAFVPGANTYTGAMLTGAAIGAMEPVSEDESRVENMAYGAGGGAVGRGLVGALSRTANPHTSQQVTRLMDEGVTPTPGQIMGGTGRKLEEALRSVPFVGDGIAAAERNAMQQFNTATINRVLAPIGRKVHGYGQEAVGLARNIISKTYDDIIGRMQPLLPDQQFSTALASARQMVDKLPDDKVSQFGRILKSEILDKLDGPMEPTVFKQVNSELARIAREYGKSPDYDQRALGDAVAALRKSLSELGARTNPTQAAALRQADEAYAGLLRIENAAARNPTGDGVFTPAQLGQSARSMDSSLRRSATARGDALLQDQAQAGRDVLGNNLPDSGTANRLASMLMLGGGYAVHPGVAAGMAAGRAAYSPPVTRALAAALARRPESVRQAGRAVESVAPLSAILGGSTATQ